MPALQPPTSARVRQDFAAASIIALPFALYLLALNLIIAPSDANWARSDPIVRILPHGVTLWAVPLAGIVAAGAWALRVGLPSREKISSALREGAVGVVVGSAIVGALRLAWGPNVPAFVPPEESAGPGFVLNMMAGYGEEVLFRVALLPLLFLALAERLPRWLAVAVAAGVTGLGFALLHEPASEAWSRTLFMTRFIMPGCLMSTAALMRSPTFIVVAHCTAHIAVPLAFTG